MKPLPSTACGGIDSASDLVAAARKDDHEGVTKKSMPTPLTVEGIGRRRSALTRTACPSLMTADRWPDWRHVRILICSIGLQSIVPDQGGGRALSLLAFVHHS